MRSLSPLASLIVPSPDQEPASPANGVDAASAPHWIGACSANSRTSPVQALRRVARTADPIVCGEIIVPSSLHRAGPAAMMVRTANSCNAARLHQQSHELAP